MIAKSKKQSTSSSVHYFQAVGRRREASAQVRIYPLSADVTEISVGGRSIKKGEMVVNGKPITEYFPGDSNRQRYTLPFRITNTLQTSAVSAKVAGGGVYGQLDAFVHGVARALDLVDHDTYHTILKKQRLLTRNARVKERRKAGLGGRARARKQSPKR